MGAGKSGASASYSTSESAICAVNGGVSMVTSKQEEKEFEVATARGIRRRATAPFAVAAHYDRQRECIVVILSSGLELAFSPRLAEGLETAVAADLEEIEISPSGLGLRFVKLDVDLYLPALLDGQAGSRRWMAARLGKQGGASRSPAKIAASRANGRRGGRPSKVTA